MNLKDLKKKLQELETLIIDIPADETPAWEKKAAAFNCLCKLMGELDKPPSAAESIPGYTEFIDALAEHLEKEK